MCFTVSSLLQRGNLCRAELSSKGQEQTQGNISPPFLSESPNHAERILPVIQFYSELTQHSFKFLETSLISTKR